MFYVFSSLVEYILAANIQKYWIAEIMRKCGKGGKKCFRIVSAFPHFSAIIINRLTVQSPRSQNQS